MHATHLNSVEVEKEGKAPSREVMNKWYDNLQRHMQAIRKALSLVEERILTSTDSNVNILANYHKEAERLSHTYVYLQQIEHNRFKLPAIEAAKKLQEEQEKQSKIVTP